MRVRECEHAVHIQDWAMRAGNRRKGNATDIALVRGVLQSWSDESVNSKSAAGGSSLFGKREEEPLGRWNTVILPPHIGI